MAIGEQSWIMQIGIYWRRKKQSGSKDKVKTKSWIALNQNLLLQLNSGVVQEKDDGHKRGVYHPAFDLKMLDLTLNLGATKCPGPVTEDKRKDILHWHQHKHNGIVLHFKRSVWFSVVGELQPNWSLIMRVLLVVFEFLQ